MYKRSVIPVIPDGYSVETERHNAALIGDYLANLKQKSWAEKTLANYEVALRQLFNFCAVADRPFEEMTASDAYNFISLELAGYAPNSQRLKISTLRSFYEYLQGVGVSEVQPFLRTFMPRRERKRFTYITDDQFLKFLKYLAGKSSFPVEFGAKLMRYAGLRVSEASNIDLFADLKRSPYGYTVFVRGKGQKERSVPVFNKAFCREIAELQSLYESPALPIKIEFTAQTLNSHLQNFSKENGIYPTLSSHDLRRAFAQDLMTQTRDIEIVRSALGHNSYNTTLIYLKDSSALLDKAAATVEM